MNKPYTGMKRIQPSPEVHTSGGVVTERELGYAKPFPCKIKHASFAPGNSKNPGKYDNLELTIEFQEFGIDKEFSISGPENWAEFMLRTDAKSPRDLYTQDFVAYISTGSRISAIGRRG